MAHLPPSVILREEFQALDSSAFQPLNACLVGPNRRNFSYGNALDLPLIALGTYDPANGGNFVYPSLPAGGQVIPGSATLTLDTVLAQFGTLAGAGVVARGAAVNQVTLGANAAGAFQANTFASRVAALGNRDLAVGDHVSIAGVTSGASVSTRILGFGQKTVAPTAGAVTAGPNNQAVQTKQVTVSTLSANGDHAAVENTTTTTYAGNLAKNILSDTYTLTCTTGGVGTAAVFAVSSFKGDNVPGVPAPALGGTLPVGTAGLVATLSGTNAYVAGESYQFVCRAATAVQVLAVTPTGYAGGLNATYQLTVVRGGTWAQGPVVSVSTLGGTDYQAPQTLAFNASFPLGTLGATAKFTASTVQNGLVAGDVYTVALTAAGLGAVNSFFTADPLPTAITQNEDLALTFFVAKASVVVPATGYPVVGSLAWTTDGTTVTVEPGLAVVDPAFTDTLGNLRGLPVASANLFLGYSALLTAQSGVLQSLSDAESVAAVLGRVEAANPLAYALYKALLNSAGQPVNFVAVDQDSLQGYADALGTLEGSDVTYFCVPTSDDAATQQLFLSHALAMSNPATARERVALGALPVSATLNLYVAKPDASFWTGYVALNPASQVTLYTKLTVPGASFLVDGVRAGDQVRANYALNASGVLGYATAAVAQVLDNQNLLLAGTGFGAAVGSPSAPTRVAILRVLTRDELAAQAAVNAGLFANRRYFNVFPNRSPAANVTAGGEPRWAYAAAVAGLKSAVAPHQGITNAALLGFTESLGYFTPTQLNVIAGGGNLVVTQDKAGGTVYVRHQLSTDMTDANSQEMSITVNDDSIVKFIRADLYPFLGRYNVTSGFLQQIKTLMLHKFEYLQNQTITATAGPQVTSFDPATLVVAGDAVTRTLVNLAAQYGLPYPCNNITGTLTVI